MTLTLGETIRNARERKGMTRTKLAEFTGISLSTLAKYELGQVSPEGKIPSIPKMVKIANVLEIDPRWIFNVVQARDKELKTKINFLTHFIEDDAAYELSHEQEMMNDPVMVKYLQERDEKFFERFDEMEAEFFAFMKSSEGNDPSHEGSDHSQQSTSEPEVAPTTSSSQPKEKEG